MDLASLNVSIVVYKKPINMHRSFNGLLSLAINELNLNLENEIYVLFMNRDRNQFKILFFQYGHASIFTMRLSGRLQEDFTKIDKIQSHFLYELIQNPISRKPRFNHILEGENY